PSGLNASHDIAKKSEKHPSVVLPFTLPLSSHVEGMSMSSAGRLTVPGPNAGSTTLAMTCACFMRRYEPGASAACAAPGAGECAGLGVEAAAPAAGAALAAGTLMAGAGLSPEAGATAAAPAPEAPPGFAACLHCCESESRCCLRQAMMRPPPEGTPAQNFWASAAQAARIAASAEPSSAKAGCMTAAAQPRNTSTNRCIGTSSGRGSRKKGGA